jgi:hypothetical protein
MGDETSAKHKFLEDSHMTFQEVFEFAFEKMIPIMKGLANELGEDQFLTALKKVASGVVFKAAQENARQLPCNDLAAFVGPIEPSYFMKHAVTLDIVENTTRTFELKVTECLWAKMFRERDAAQIGYSLICNTDYADCQGFNPKIFMTRSKTLMQGDDYCNHRFVWEE